MTNFHKELKRLGSVQMLAGKAAPLPEAGRRMAWLTKKICVGFVQERVTRPPVSSNDIEEVRGEESRKKWNEFEIVEIHTFMVETHFSSLNGRVGSISPRFFFSSNHHFPTSLPDWFYKNAKSYEFGLKLLERIIRFIYECLIWCPLCLLDMLNRKLDSDFGIGAWVSRIVSSPAFPLCGNLKTSFWSVSIQRPVHILLHFEV